MTSEGTDYPAIVAAAFEAQRGMLWGLAYRMTGGASEADDIVQATFLRALERPPADSSRSLAPWLTRVAMNLARDRLRRRKRAMPDYIGSWLPEPAPETAHEPEGERRIVLRESASFAVLLALEVLTPLQRAVLLLHDVMDFSTRDAAKALETTEGNIKTILHRARAALSDARDTPEPGPLPARIARNRAALAALMAPLLNGDLDGVRRVLTADISVTTDAGGEFSAATKSVFGPEAVARFFVGLMGKFGAPTQMAEVALNGTVGWMLTYAPKPNQPRFAVRQFVALQTDAAGGIRRVYTVMATAKLQRLFEHSARASAP